MLPQPITSNDIQKGVIYGRGLETYTSNWFRRSSNFL